jgi:hypothetical protein
MVESVHVSDSAGEHLGRIRYGHTSVEIVVPTVGTRMSSGQSYISVPRPVAISSHHADVTVAEVERIFIVVIVVEILVPRTVWDDYTEMLSYGVSATHTLFFKETHCGRKGRKERKERKGRKERKVGKEGKLEGGPRCFPRCFSRSIFFPNQ